MARGAPSISQNPHPGDFQPRRAERDSPLVLPPWGASDNGLCRAQNLGSMADIKFSCSGCGQHISCDAVWSGRELQCPACGQTISVPQAPAAPAPLVQVTAPQPTAATRPKLAAGATSVARPSPTVSGTQRRTVPRPPKGPNPAIRYAGWAVGLVVLAIAGLKFGPGLLSQVQGSGSSHASGAAASTPSAGAGPLGEVNGTMDVSDALDGGAPTRSPAAVRRAPASAPVRAASANQTNLVPRKTP